jgi:hypothetical protein
MSQHLGEQLMTRAEEGPPFREIQIAVPGDLVLVQEPGLLVWAGAFTVSSRGFGFALRITANVSDPDVHMPEPFALHPHQRDHGTWLSVRFADGRSCAAVINNGPWSGDLDDLHVGFMFGDESTSDGRADSRWWVSALPPTGPVELVIHLNGQAGPEGAGVLDTPSLLEASASVESM